MCTGAVDEPVTLAATTRAALGRETEGEEGAAESVPPSRPFQKGTVVENAVKHWRHFCSKGTSKPHHEGGGHVDPSSR